MLIEIDKKHHRKTLLFIAEAFSQNKVVVESFNSLYKTNKAIFFEEASTYLSQSVAHREENGTLEFEITMKRILGVLAYAEIDEFTKLAVYKIVKLQYQNIVKIVREKAVNTATTVYNLALRAGTTALSNAVFRIFYYVSFLEYGYIFETNSFFGDAFNRSVSLFDYHINFTSNTKSIFLQEIENRKIEISQKLKRYNSVLSFNDIQRIQDVFDRKDGIIVGKENTAFANETFDKELLESGGICYSIATRLCDLENLSISLLIGDIHLSKSDRQLLMNNIITTLDKHNINTDVIEDDLYMFSILFQSLIKEYKRAKAFYNANNEETFLLEKDYNTAMIKKLNEENYSLKNCIVSFENEKTEFQNNCQKEANSFKKSLYNDMNLLQIENCRLQKSIDDFEVQKDELNRLREYVYSLTDEKIKPPDEEVKFEDIILDKKIVIVGGHSTWHQQIKNMFPQIILIDGTKTNIDLKLFDNSDVVLFFTGILKHKTYYKVKDYLRKTKICYNYIPSQNIDAMKITIGNLLKEQGD